MNIVKIAVEAVMDEQGHPVAVMPYNGRATIYLCREANVEQTAELLKDLADSEPFKVDKTPATGAIPNSLPVKEG